MDLQGLRSLNLIGTILFGLVGFLLVAAQSIQLFIIYSRLGVVDFYICFGLWIIWMLIIITFTILFYRNLVIGLDEGKFERAKKWTLIAIIVGFAGGILPLIIFIISYVSFDDATRPRPFDPYHGYPQDLTSIKTCKKCQRQIPYDSKLCPYCGLGQQSPQSTNLPPPPPHYKKP